MVQTIQAPKATLRTLIDDFEIQLVEDQAFFPEWQGNLSMVGSSDERIKVVKMKKL